MKVQIIPVAQKHMHSDTFEAGRRMRAAIRDAKEAK